MQLGIPASVPEFVISNFTLTVAGLMNSEERIFPENMAFELGATGVGVSSLAPNIATPKRTKASAKITKAILRNLDCFLRNTAFSSGVIASSFADCF